MASWFSNYTGEKLQKNPEDSFRVKKIEEGGRISPPNFHTLYSEVISIQIMVFKKKDQWSRLTGEEMPSRNQDFSHDKGFDLERKEWPVNQWWKLLTIHLEN
jgi:hypothetical protein